MDVGSIVSNAVGGLMGGLALLLLVKVGKRIRIILKQRAKQPKEVLDKTLLNSQEYKDILSRRKFHRVQGYGAFIWLLSLIAVLISAWVQNGTIWIHFKSIGDAISSIGLLISLVCLSPIELYLGYSPITSQEVEQKRQNNRQRKLKEAHGARPYGYIFQEIIFPIFFWLYFVFCVVSLVLILTFPPPSIHIPIAWVILALGLAIPAGVHNTYLQLRTVFENMKDLKNVPDMRKSELRQKLTQDEFNNSS